MKQVGFDEFRLEGHELTLKSGGEARKLLSAKDGTNLEQRLTRIQGLLLREPILAGEVVDLLSGVQAKTPEIFKKLNELYTQCAEILLSRKAPLDPEVGAEIVRGISSVEMPNDIYLCEELEKEALKKDPYAYSLYLRSLQRKQCLGRVMQVDTRSASTALVTGLGRLSAKTGERYFVDGVVDSKACSMRADLPSEILAFAALMEATGDLKAALTLMQVMVPTMRMRSFDELASFWVHFQKLLILDSLRTEVITDETTMQAYNMTIETIEAELFAITNGMDTANEGTKKVQRMKDRHQVKDIGGAPLNSLPAVFYLALAFSDRAKSVYCA